ncbi:MAG: hypothetical protein IVW56_13185 [Candidatus Binataceae bacterium]|nr:hypothetical protein [Candidatus Binataceae bacterium]
MPKKQKDRHHGSAMLAIIEHPTFTALNKLPTGTTNTYLVNDNTPLLVKYATKKNTTGRWVFTVNRHEAKAIQKLAKAQGDRFFLLLVCGDVSVCVVDWTDINLLVDFNAARTSVRCLTKKGTKIRVFAGRGKQAKVIKIAAGNFPKALF